jgi:hypothetical protein
MGAVAAAEGRHEREPGPAAARLPRRLERDGAAHQVHEACRKEKEKEK